MGQQIRSGGAFVDSRRTFQADQAFQALEAQFDAPSQDARKTFDVKAAERAQFGLGSLPKASPAAAGGAVPRSETAKARAGQASAVLGQSMLIRQQHRPQCKLEKTVAPGGIPSVLRRLATLARRRVPDGYALETLRDMADKEPFD